jgi:transposase
MLSAMLYVLRTGVPWRDLPGCYGGWGSVYTRYRRWCRSGLFARMLTIVARGACGELRHFDCSHIKLHQHAANPRGGQSAQAIGRTRGGLNTKLAAAVETHGRAIAVALAPGQQNDHKAVLPLLPALRGARAVGDKAFATGAFYRHLQHHHVRACLPKKRRERQPAPFHRGYYRQRHKIENFFGRIKCFRRISTRYDKLALTFLGFVQLAAVIDWLSFRF